MRVLVTGATSMIGRTVINRLVERGDEVTSLQRRPSGIEGIAEIQGSITDIDVVERAVEGQELSLIHI